VLKRVSEFDDFSSCYPDNQMKARGAVATVAQLVNKKDSFTRMRDERERELQRHRDAHRADHTPCTGSLAKPLPDPPQPLRPGRQP
jgi:hypothetical protein